MSKPPASPPVRPRDPSTGTTPDDIPPVHVLEAAQAQDRKETEDLLAGFDRGGRGPKRPVAERDFVDYFARKNGGEARERVRVPGPPAHPAPHAMPTVAKARWDERPAREMPPWAGWVGIAALMVAIGTIVAFVATSEPSPRAAAAGGATTTTLTSTSAVAAARDAVPAPPPQTSSPSEPLATTPTTITASPSAPSAARTKRDRHSPTGVPASTPLPATGPDGTGPTRDDLIRDM